jgi:hypothetical protein
MNTHKIKNILIFPCGTPEALEFSAICSARGDNVIGASSPGNDVNRSWYKTAVRLPWITEDNFSMAFKQLLDKYAIDTIYAPFFPIYDKLKHCLTEIIRPIELITLPTANEKRAISLALKQRVEAYTTFTQNSGFPPPLRGIPPLTQKQLMALLIHFNRIEGQCSEEKFAALCAIAPSLPVGDVVEIGTMFGKSAFVLGYLGKHYQVGKLLCIDPWENTRPVQKEAHHSLLNADPQREYDLVLDKFVANLYPYFYGLMNFMQAQSDEAYQQYSRTLTVSSESFGTTHYTGQIACLHIDGNHDFAYVKRDIEKWTPHVVAGGWVILDDYDWCFGTGPRRAGDELLTTWRETISTAFVCGGALFILKSGGTR